MVTIQTVTSSIVDQNGNLATGYITIRPSESFSFVDTGSVKRLVVNEAIQIDFLDGKINPFGIAPTVNASQNKSNLYYIAQFTTNSVSWTEYWVIDISPTSLEITDITNIVVGSAPKQYSYLLSDNVSVIAGANKVPRATSDGTLDPSYIPGTAGILSYVQVNAPASPTSSQNAVWRQNIVGDTETDFTVYWWNGTSWSIWVSGTYENA